MPSFEVRLHPLAEHDLAQLLEFVASQNVNAARKLSARLRGQFERLSQFPKLGKAIAHKRYKNAALRSLRVDAHLLIYAIEGKTIWVYRVVNASRDLDRVLAE